MAVSRTFRVVMQDGKFHLTAPKAYAEFCARIGDGEERDMVIKTAAQRQGTQSLRYLRGVVIPDIAEACGYNPEDPDECQDVYDGVMWRLFRLPDGKFGQPRRESCSKDSMSQERITEVIDKIIVWAETTITGCSIRRPEDVEMDQIRDHEFAA
jgi:hypothetical protein